MKGGRIIGEGVDGCVFTEPMWPCSADTYNPALPNLLDNRYVSKIVATEDREIEYRKIAQRLLGNLAKEHLTFIKGECKPADDAHPPHESQADIYKSVKNTVLHWKKPGQKCSVLQDMIKGGKSFSESHKIAFITRYLMSVKAWYMWSKKPVKEVLSGIVNAVGPFIEALQLLYQQPHEQLIHIDLHIDNIFVKHSPVHFGLTDFGHCLSRRSSDSQAKQASTFLGYYLTKYVANFRFFVDYSQVPLEARLLNYCYVENMDSVAPDVLVRGWMKEVQKVQKDSTDLIVMEVFEFTRALLRKPFFISMIQYIQQISRKLRVNSNDPVQVVQSMSRHEKVILEFIVTRYMAITPINTIVEGVMLLPCTPPTYSEVKPIVSAYFKNQKYRNDDMNFYKLIHFLTKAIMRPYTQEGSSLVSVVASVQVSDLRIVWDDISEKV